MVLPDIRLLQAAIVLAEELHFSRAADRLHITQSALSKQISKLEDEISFQLFIHNHQVVEITEAGRVFVEEAREAVFHAERAVLSGRAIANGAEELLNLGKSAYTDPFLVSTLLSIHLPLFPGMKTKVWSNFSNDLVQQVIAGSIDVAVVTGVPDNSKLRLETIANNPFYIAMSMQDDLARHREIRLADMNNRNWILLGQHANPYLYDMIQTVASERGIRPLEIHPFTSPDEASELIREYQGLAFLPRTAAWRIARDGITMRPLAEDRLRLVARLAVRSNNKSRLVNEFVHTAMRKLRSVGQTVQTKLPLTG
ncbi:LysR family transcriptional regulator [Silvibacterium acidisoli]|uniref:LysR family transcriptional regulator n=1 Tax=Acidobacteriaceae bacterium ZG23-2 TaxID=2883246 RepID=UPI00406CDE77